MPTRLAAKKRIISEEQKESRRLYAKRHSQEHPEYYEKYRQDNKEKIRQAAKKWALNNPEKVRAKSQRQRDKDPDASRRYDTAYRRMRRAKLKELESRKIS